MRGLIVLDNQTRLWSCGKCACQFRIIAAGQKDYTACYYRVLGIVAIVMLKEGSLGLWGFGMGEI